MSVRFINTCICLMILAMLSGCQSNPLLNDTTDTSTSSTSETAVTLTREITSDLGLTSIQAAVLDTAVGQAEEEAFVPGFLWRVAVHVQENLLAADKADLLVKITQIEDHLVQRGLCLPLGHEFVFNAPPFQEHPLMFVPLLDEAQRASFEARVIIHEVSVGQLIGEREGGLISPEAFHEAMHALRERLMRDIHDLLREEQRQELVRLRAELEIRRQQFFLQSQIIMTAALRLSIPQLEGLVQLRDQVETDRHALIKRFRENEIDQDILLTGLRALCGPQETTLNALLDDTQLEVRRIYRVLTFRPRRQG